jgi:hypothetical protein
MSIVQIVNETITIHRRVPPPGLVVVEKRSVPVDNIAWSKSLTLSVPSSDTRTLVYDKWEKRSGFTLYRSVVLDTYRFEVAVDLKVIHRLVVSRGLSRQFSSPFRYYECMIHPKLIEYTTSKSGGAK